MKPIKFNDEMVRAILDGRKTQTRRPVEYVEIGNAIQKWEECPYGRVGDRLWVQEAYAPYDAHGLVEYRADSKWPSGTTPEGFCWSEARKMPRNASRITLEITAVRVERVQDITYADAMADGFTGEDPRFEFREMWNAIYGGRHEPLYWGKNPWVWVIEFKVVK